MDAARSEPSRAGVGHDRGRKSNTIRRRVDDAVDPAAQGRGDDNGRNSGPHLKPRFCKELTMHSATSTMLALFCAMPALAAPAALAETGATQPTAIQVIHPDAAAAKKTVTGTLTIIAVLTVNKDLPKGASISFTGSASVF